ncbi:MAG: 6,7-dimethyl-8-ribityllumazine synthase [Helicobacteraceae bacterium]|nr:6,7-dimethyl-8-ribityllumazine synthase [Helicobacteraceae bacterium]
MNTFQGNLNIGSAERVAIIASRFNHLITDRLVEGAKDSFIRHGGDESKLDLVLVPGAYEIPFALNKILDKDKGKKYSGICCLGAVIRGATPHFDYVSAEATKGIANVALKYNACVSFGLLTTDTIEQAIERAGTKAGNKGFEAMNSLIELINLYKKF